MSHSFFDRPDGTDKSQYPVWNELLPSEWAWEFVRRNPEYRQDHADQLAKSPPFDPSDFSYKAIEENAKSVQKMMELGDKWGFFLQPPPDTPAYEIQNKNGKRSVIRNCSPLSVNGCPNMYGGPASGMLSFSHSHSHTLTTDNKTVLVEFDLSKSLDTQWVMARKELMEKKSKAGFRTTGKSKGKKHIHLKRLPLLLRVLDAESSNVINDLYGSDDVLNGLPNKDKKTAKKLMETGYKDLVECDGKEEFSDLL